MKTRDEILAQPFVNIQDIKNLLSISEQQSKKLFYKISAQEDSELGEFRVVKNKVKLTNVLKSQKLTLSQLKNAL